MASFTPHERQPFPLQDEHTFVPLHTLHLANVLTSFKASILQREFLSKIVLKRTDSELTGFPTRSTFAVRPAFGWRTARHSGGYEQPQRPYCSPAENNEVVASLKDSLATFVEIPEIDVSLLLSRS